MIDQDINSQQFIVFRTGNQEFSVEMGSTREIKSWTKATKLPNSEEYVVGIINLRGTIVPIVDLSLRLGLQKIEERDQNVIIVVKLHDKQFGLLVESVSDIIEASEDQLRPVPELSTKYSEEFFRQVIVLENRIICEVVLDKLVPEMDAMAA